MSSQPQLSSKPVPRFILIAVGFGLMMLLFRPHGDTFTALDHSGYRLMSVAFSEGRGLHEQDQVLMEVPESLRQAFLLYPHMRTRNTRDRSFRVHSLHHGNTEPFFYPLIPALAAGMEMIFPGYGRDALMPLFGGLFFAILLIMGYRKGALIGFGVALVFCLGSPLPVWLFRGFYIEAAAAALVAWAVYLWMFRSRLVFLATFLTGLSASVHPTFLVLGPPLGVLMMIGPRVHRREALLASAGLVVGLLPLFVMTVWVAAPYGRITLTHLLDNLRVSTPHQLVFAGLLISLMLLGLSLFAKSLRECLCEWMRAPLVRVLISFCALTPFLWTAFVWGQHTLVQQGLREFWLAIRWPMGLLFPLGVWQLHRRSCSLKPFAVWGLLLISLPLFTYLKGVEQMGMWSQRRLLPTYTLLSLSLLPSCATVLAYWNQREPRPLITVLLSAGLLLCTFSNIIRWPAPYWVQVEKGALAEVQDLQAQIGDRLAFFDYLPYSFPFAVTNRTRALGLNEESYKQLPEIVDWLAEKSRQEEVWWFTAYANPGLEDGVRLNEIRTIEFPLDRINAKLALPAERKSITISMTVLEALPVQAEGDLAVDKVLDGGLLALRGAWGNYRRSIKTESGERVPAEWTRKRSGIIGPMPSFRSGVRLTLWAASGRDVPQQVTVIPPWPDAEVDIEIPSAFGEVELWLPAPPEGVLGDKTFTGTYTFFIPTPYDPETEGVRGFANDLGFLCHRIRIERDSGL